jgi:hypothetical protein
MPKLKLSTSELPDCAGGRPPSRWTLPPVKGGYKRRLAMTISVGVLAIILNACHSYFQPIHRIILLPALLWFLWRQWHRDGRFLFLEGDAEK